MPLSTRFISAALLAGTLSALAPASAFGQMAAPLTAEEPQTFDQSYVTANVNVRRGPGTNERVVNRLRRGDFVNVGECRGNWCYVDAFGGNGWVSGRFIGRGENPYNSRGPAGPGIPPQEPGTRD